MSSVPLVAAGYYSHLNKILFTFVVTVEIHTQRQSEKKKCNKEIPMEKDENALCFYEEKKKNFTRIAILGMFCCSVCIE